MKYYARKKSGGYELVQDRQRITDWIDSQSRITRQKNNSEADLIAIPDCNELKIAAVSVISEEKTSKAEEKTNLINAINKSTSIQEIYDEMVKVYKAVLPNEKNEKFSLYLGNGMLAKAIRYVFMQHLHMQLGDKLNQDDEVMVTTKIPGIRSLIFGQQVESKGHRTLSSGNK
jgi:hypothetical protein